MGWLDKLLGRDKKKDEGEATPAPPEPPTMPAGGTTPPPEEPKPMGDQPLQSGG